jgi:hypothetical protein
MDSNAPLTRARIEQAAATLWRVLRDAALQDRRSDRK